MPFLRDLKLPIPGPLWALGPGARCAPIHQQVFRAISPHKQNTLYLLAQEQNLLPPIISRPIISRNMDSASEFLPRDDLSEAVYTTVKLDAIYSNASGRDTHGPNAQSESPLEEGSNDISIKRGTGLDGLNGLAQNGTPDHRLLTSSRDLPVEKSRDAAISSGPARPWSLRKVLAGAHQGWVRSIAVDPVSNSWFATGLADALIKVWDLASNTVKATLPGHIMGVRALAISPKYPYIFSGSEDKTVRCWDLERSNSPAGCQIRDYHGHVGGIYALALHPELDLLFSAGRDSAIRVWDIRSRTQVMVLTGHRGDITSLATQLGDPQVCSSSMDSTVKLWDLRNQKAALTMTHHTKSVRLMQMHPHEMTMVSADLVGSIKQWVLPKGQLLNSFEKTDAARDANIINTLLINPATNELFAGYNDGRMQFWDYESGRCVQECETRPSPGTDLLIIYASAFDMLGMRLITCENDKSIKIWGNDD